MSSSEPPTASGAYGCQAETAPMLNHFHAHRVKPITVSAEDANIGPRVGGSAPEGVLPRRVGASTQYFATVWLDPAATREVSIFVDVDADEESPKSIYRNVSQLKSSDELVQMVIHPKSERSDSKYLASPLTARGLQIWPETEDIVVPPGGELRLPSKMGGKPYFYYNSAEYVGAITRLYEQGFVLFLQMTWAGSDAAPRGPWPFDEYTFHLFAKEGSGEIIWRYGWG